VPEPEVFEPGRRQRRASGTAAQLTCMMIGIPAIESRSLTERLERIIG
jgi:hypothetical protein